MSTQKPTLTHYQIPAGLMQGIVNALGSLPWGQINGVMSPLIAEVQQQEAAAVEPPAGTKGTINGLEVERPPAPPQPSA